MIIVEVNNGDWWWSHEEKCMYWCNNDSGTLTSIDSQGNISHSTSRAMFANGMRLSLIARAGELEAEHRYNGVGDSRICIAEALARSGVKP